MKRAIGKLGIGKPVAGVVAFVLALALFAPFIPADRYREPTRTGLEAALGRKVEISSVRFRVLPQPGFTLNNVTVGEDPAIGSEPVAYVTTLRAIPRISALLGGRLEFASVDLEEASLNLTRVDKAEAGVSWNFSALMRPQALSAFPALHIHSGRINFKFGDTKSLFYLLNTDVDVWPPSSEPSSGKEPWVLRVKGEPARTDRPAHGFGSFVANGEWFTAEGRTTLDVKLEKSELGDMLELFNGHQSGVQGSVSGNAHLAGPLSKIGVSGKLTVANLHGWNQSPPGGNEWPMTVGGVLDATGQTIDLTARLAAKQSPVEFRYKASDYLKRPVWEVTATLSQFPMGPVLGIARNLGWKIPPDFRLDATADGSVTYSMPLSAITMNGGVTLANFVLTTASGPALKVPAASLQFAGSAIALPATVVTDEAGETASLEGSWDIGTGAAQASLSSGGMSVAAIAKPLSLAGVPLLGLATAGNWKGKLFYDGDGWQGDVHLQDTLVPFEAFADPLRIVSADASVHGAEMTVKRLSLSTGGLEAQGEYRYVAGAPHPHQFKLTLPKASAEAVEKLMMPALHRGNFFTYAFNFGRVPEPDWLRSMGAEGTVQVGTLDLAGNEFSKVQARIVWDAMDIRLEDLKSQLGAAAFAGSAGLHLDARQPSYEAEGKVRGFAWRSGTVSGEATLVTSGTGADLLDHLKMKGTFDGRGIDLTPLDSYQTVGGTFELAWDGRGPKVHVPDLATKSAKGAMQGTADSQDNEQVVVKLTDGSRKVQAAGALFRGEALTIVP